MWIILKDGSLEITAEKANKSSDLFVGGRGPLCRLFPDVDSDGMTDVHFFEFAKIDRNRVADVIANEVRGIRYKSFEPDPSDLDPWAGARTSLDTPMPPGHFTLDLDGPVLATRSSNTVLLTVPCPYGSVTMLMTATRARRVTEELTKAISGGK